MTADELLFFDVRPYLLPIYGALREAVFSLCPGAAVKVSKTQISFYDRHMFAMASLPRRQGERHLLVSLGMPEPIVSPRVSFVSEPYPGRWTCHIPVSAPEEIDGELLGWLEEAHRFTVQK